MNLKNKVMKANAPEKIYVDSNAIGNNTSTTVHTKRQDYPTCTEYTRTDAFIEKACDWFKNNWREYVNTDKDGVVCFGHWEKDFRKYMEGE